MGEKRGANDLVEAVDRMAEALETIAEALNGIGSRIAEDVPLNHSVGMAANRIQEGLEQIR